MYVRHPKTGGAKCFLTSSFMFVRQKKNKSGSTSIVIVNKLIGTYKEIQTIGIGKSDANSRRFGPPR